MMNFCHCQVIGILGSSKTYVEEELPGISKSENDPSSVEGATGSSFTWMKKSRKISDNLSEEKVKTSTWIVSKTMKGTLKLIKRMFQAGSAEKSLRRSFALSKDERLLEAYSCSLFSTAGPIQGIIFITSERMAFRSKRSLKLNTSKGKVAKVPYKVSIPLGKVKKTTTSENMNRPVEKYLQIVTIDDFEFWFSGFVNYKRSFESLCLALSLQQ